MTFIDLAPLGYYRSDDGTEAWYDYDYTNSIRFHCIEHNYNGTEYLLGAWFLNQNYKNHWHICRFQVKSKSFIKAFNKLKKLCNQKDIDFNGETDVYENTSGSYWRKQ